MGEGYVGMTYTGFSLGLEFPTLADLVLTVVIEGLGSLPLFLIELLV